MSTMFRKEWRTVLHSLWGYGFLALFFLLFGIMATVFHCSYGYTNFEFGLPYYCLAAALSFPLLTVPMFRREHRGEGDQLLTMLPLSAKDRILGKLLCLVSLFCVVCAVSALFPLVLHWMTGVALPSAYLSLLVFLLFGLALLMIEAFVSMTVKNTVVAWIVSYGIPVLLVLVNNLADLIPVASVKTAVEYLSLMGATTPFVFSLVDLRVLILYGSVAALFFLLSYFFGKKKAGEPAPKRKGRGVLLVSVLVLCGLLLNVGVALIPSRFRTMDGTPTNLYTLSDGAKKFLSEIDEDVTLYLVKESGDDRRFEYFLERLAAQNKHLTLKTVKLEDSAEILSKVGATTDQMTSVGYCLVVESAHRSEIIDYNSLFYYETASAALGQLGMSRMSVSDYYQWLNTFYSYANQSEDYLPYLDAMLNETYMYFQGQGVICSMLEYVLADVIPNPYVLSGNGEMEFGTIFREAYGILNLTTVSEIPPEVASLYIIDPAEDYTAEEIEMLKRYLGRGGQITVVTGEKHLSMPNLMSLMASYGMTASAGAVGIDKEVKVEGAEGEEATTETQRSSKVDVIPNLQHDAFAAGASETMLAPAITNGNDISFVKTEDASLIQTALLTTSDKAFVGEDRSTAGKKVLAAAAEKSDGSHLLWFTGAESYTVPISEQAKNLDAIYNMFCLYMVETWSTLNYRPTVKIATETLYQVDYSAPAEFHGTLFGVVVIGAIPLTLLCVGIVIWYKRKKA